MGIELWRNTTSFPPGIEPSSKVIDKKWRKNPGTKWKKPCLKTTNRQSSTIINCTNVEGHLVVFSVNWRWQKFTVMYKSMMVPFYIHLPKVKITKNLKLSNQITWGLKLHFYDVTVHDSNGSSNKELNYSNISVLKASWFWHPVYVELFVNTLQKEKDFLAKRIFSIFWGLRNLH